MCRVSSGLSGDWRQARTVLSGDFGKARGFADFEIAFGDRDMRCNSGRLDTLLGQFELSLGTALVIVEIERRVSHDTLHSAGAAFTALPVKY